jgi:hypothetical protein
VTIAATLLAASACSAQCGPVAKTPATTPVAAASSPSPRPSPTAPLAASSPPFHSGEAGLAYAAVALSASGGRAPYTWSVVSGALPDGLALSNDGSVSGSPSTAGIFSFTIQVADSGNGTATIPGTIQIAEQLTAGLNSSCAQYCRVELGCDSTCGTFGHLAGGVGPYTYTVTQGPLPAGTSLNGLSLAGTFKGLSGYLKFTVQVADSLGGTATIAPTFWMYDHISVGSGQCYRVFGDCSLRLPIAGGVPGGAPSVTLASEAPAPGQGCWPASPNPLPNGYTLTVTGGFVDLYIPRSQNTGGYGGVWTLVITDHTYCASNTYCTTQATATIGIECT